MPGDNKPSFIPKRTPNKKSSQKKIVRRVYILDYIAYIVFFGGLIATAGVFVYELQTTNELVGIQDELVEERNNFSDAEMSEIVELEKRIDAAYDRVQNNVSIFSLLNALEDLVVESIRFKSLHLSREEDEKVAVDVVVSTDSFDSTIFQRRVLKGDELANGIVIQDLNVNVDRRVADAQGISNALSQQLGVETERIGFTLLLDIPRDNILFDPTVFREQPQLQGIERRSFPIPGESVEVDTEEQADETQTDDEVNEISI